VEQALEARTVAIRLGAHAVVDLRAARVGGNRELQVERLGPVDVLDAELAHDLLLRLERLLRLGDQLVVELLTERVVLRLAVVRGHLRAHVRLVEEAREIEVLGLPVHHVAVLLEQVHAAHHLVDGAEAELGHVLAQLLGDEHHHVDDVLGLARELLAQLRILRGHADRTRVEVADAHQDAAARHQGRRGDGQDQRDLASRLAGVAPA